MNGHRDDGFKAPSEEIARVAQEAPWLGLHKLFGAISSLAVRCYRFLRVFVWKPCVYDWRIPALAAAICAFSCVEGRPAVNVYLASGTPVTLQADLIANLTNFFTGTLVASTFQPGSYSYTITGKKAGSCGQTVILPCDLDADVRLMVQASTWSYVYGFAAGQSYERFTDQGILSNTYVQCASTDTCQSGLSRASSVIYQQDLSTPTVIPGF